MKKFVCVVIMATLLTACATRAKSPNPTETPHVTPSCTIPLPVYEEGLPVL